MSLSFALVFIVSYWYSFLAQFAEKWQIYSCENRDKYKKDLLLLIFNFEKIAAELR